MHEQAVIVGQTRRMVGVITEPRPAGGGAGEPAYILLNAGLVHRVGPSRLYVKLARRLAAQGVTVLRFDHSGIGDSEVAHDNRSYIERTIIEAGEAMDTLDRLRGIRRFVLLGVCSGAATAFRAATEDPRVVGAVLINAQAFYDEQEWNRHVFNQRWANEYWTQSLFRWDSWRRALTGRIQYKRLLGVLGRRAKNLVWKDKTVRTTSDRLRRDIRALLDREVRLSMIYSEGDRGLEYLNLAYKKDAAARLVESGVAVTLIPNADHTFTLLRDQRRLIEAIERWRQTPLNPAEEA